MKDEKISQEPEKEEESQVQGNEAIQEPVMMSVSQEQWDHLQNELKEIKEKNLRILAESENTRKRLQKEKMELQTYAKENLICEFLNPIDHFANALSFKEQQSDEIKNWMVGFEMILAQFKDVLHQNEIRPIEAVGHRFDPHYHEAMETEETNEFKPHTVMEEYMKGYLMGDRVIRPAKVKVAKEPKPDHEEDFKESNETINQKEG